MYHQGLIFCFNFSSIFWQIDKLKIKLIKNHNNTSPLKYTSLCRWGLGICLGHLVPQNLLILCKKTIKKQPSSAHKKFTILSNTSYKNQEFSQNVIIGSENRASVGIINDLSPYYHTSFYSINIHSSKRCISIWLN